MGEVVATSEGSVACYPGCGNSLAHGPCSQSRSTPPVDHGNAGYFFDAGFRAHSRGGTVGAILLTPDGSFVAAYNGLLPTCYSPLMAESLACSAVLSWLKGRGITSVQVYTDCSTLKNLLTAPSSSLFSYVGYSIDASRAIMSTFVSCTVSYVPRFANRAAHTLATMAFSQDIVL
ncbi:uncharacterized protein LOC116029874 [Ipomoea triloba]|uniref:uncharacterized protein LOC116029874 n=1 Tax=Ipomoea triloba TaxID=35885 RepID=UPI00125D4B0C|nr:uncharacterized protein LOC116029874 [Ipomoea triloba]